MRSGLAVAALVAAGALRSQAQEEGSAPRIAPVHAPAKSQIDSVDFAFNFYDQSDRGGDPLRKEEVMILQPMILLGATLSEDWSATLMLQGDAILGKGDATSGASGAVAAGAAGGSAGGAGELEGEDEEEEGGAAGASESGLGVSEMQYAGSLGLNYRWSPQFRIGGGFSASREDDYESRGLYLSGAYETADKNDSFAFRLTGLRDAVDVTLFDGTDGGEDERRTISPGFAWTHILTERTILTLNYDLTLQSGHLETASQSVTVGTTVVGEELPGSRLRHGVFLRGRHLLLETLAVETGIGLYADDWGARAFSPELNLYWEAVPNLLIVRPGLRYHSQDAVDYFVDAGAAAIPGYRTQDSDLGEFTDRSLGLKLTFLRSPFLGDEFEIAADLTSRSDGIEWFTVTAGFSWRH